MTREEREQIYMTLRQNLKYDENVGNPEHQIRKQMKGMSIPAQMDFEVERIDNASYGKKVVGNSYDAALYLARKFGGYVIQKVNNEQVTHYYVAYLDEDKNLRVANPASDMINCRLNGAGRLDIPIESFRTKSLLTFEIGAGAKIIRGGNNFLEKLQTNLWVHNYKVMNGHEPSFSEITEAGYDPADLTYVEDKPCHKETTRNF